MKQLPLLSHQLPEKLWATRGEETDEELDCRSSDFHQKKANRKEQSSSGGQVDKSSSTVRTGRRFTSLYNIWSLLIGGCVGGGLKKTNIHSSGVV